MALNIVFSFGLLGVLLAIAVIDLRRQIIPDRLNLALLAGGLLFAWASPAMSLQQSLIGTLSGAVFFAAVRSAYFRLRGIHGLGLGDVKFLASAGSWVGVLGLPYIILLASIAGMALLAIQQLRGQTIAATTRLAFGPHLCLGLFTTWIFKMLEML
jgi:leader peptidase (prepilin peptidase) / N-methyltransferase